MRKNFIDYLKDNRKEKKLRLFFDIETLQYNEEEGRKKPSNFKNVTYSLAVSWLDGDIDEEQVAIFPNFLPFFETIKEAFTQKNGAVYKTTPQIELIAHNSNKYDNHFLLADMEYYFPDMEIENMHLTMANEEGNTLALKLKDIPKDQKQRGLILEKRIKSGNALELIFFYHGIQFQTTDNYMKTNVSVKTLGVKLLNKGLIKEAQLKTDFDYTKYNRDYDMTEREAREYALQCYLSLDEDQKTYIRNDVIILGKSVLYYRVLFNGFDYEKITFTSNILEYYNDNDLASFQLLNKVGKGRETLKIEYTEFQFANENFYDFLKPFYKGGLNLYNQRYLAMILTDPAFAIDLNSSYPFAMHNFKIPTFLNAWEEYETETSINIELSDDFYHIYRMEKETFDKEILKRIPSRIVRQLLVKYYSGNDHININSYTIRMIQKVCKFEIPTLTVTSWIKWDCVYFGSRDKIEEMYFVKTQGKEANKIEMDTPYNITLTDELNLDNVFTPEEVDNSKVLLNGLYGIPALRPYFNLFRRIGENIINIKNGYHNNQRNIVFSIFVTSVSLYNLIEPFSYLTQKEIDDNFIYCDTDSLYFFQKVRHKFPDSMFHDYNLGKWGIDEANIKKMYVLNHKKYAYVSDKWNKETNQMDIDKITVKSAGVPHDAFDTAMTFEKFVETQFSHGVTIKNLKSIYNAQRTISLYESETDLEQGKTYQDYAFNPYYDLMKEQLFKEVRESETFEEEDTLYIESNIGTFSMADIDQKKHSLNMCTPLLFLQWKQDTIKDKLVLQ